MKLGTVVSLVIDIMSKSFDFGFKRSSSDLHLQIVQIPVPNSIDSKSANLLSVVCSICIVLPPGAAVIALLEPSPLSLTVRLVLHFFCE